MTIPTPYIGGAGGQQADRPEKKEMAPPFFTEDEAVEAGAQPEAQPGTPEPADALADLDLAEEFEIEPAAEGEEVSELALDEESDASEKQPLEPPAAAPSAPEPVSAEDPGFGIDDGGFPDFLEGPDAAEPDAPASASSSTPIEIEVPTAPPAEAPATMGEPAVPIDPPFEPVEAPFTVDEITAMAARLMTGEYSDWIMQLKDDLGPIADETAVLGAFAAGYLAAMADMEKD